MKNFNKSYMYDQTNVGSDPLLRPNQNGFCTERTTTSQILALRRIIEGIKEYNLKAVLTFINFKKAFDMVHRGMMLKILKAYTQDLDQEYLV